MHATSASSASACAARPEQSSDREARRSAGQANEDVDGVIEHCVGTAGPRAAVGFIDALDRAYAHIARQLGAGSLRYAHELGPPGLRSLPLTRCPYPVFYMERDDHMDAWRVLQAQRDIPAWMSDDPA